MSGSNTQVRTRLILVKRPATELDEQNRISGSLDLPLSAAGERQARRLADTIEGIDEISCIVAAAGFGSHQAAKIIVGQRKIKVRMEPTWQNLDHGLWHGLCQSELKLTHPKYYRQWRDNPESIAPPGGETITDLVDRVRPAMAKLLKKRAGETILIIAPDPLLTILRELAHQVDNEYPDWDLETVVN